MRTYTVKEIRKYTGLSRKQLFCYEKSIAPIGYANAAKYKLYDHDGLEKLSMAALYAELGASPKRINKLFQGEINRKELMDCLIVEAKEKIKELEDIVTIAEAYREADISILSFNPLIATNRHELAESIRKELNSNDFRVIEKAFDDKNIEENFARIIKLISQSINESDNNIEDQKIETAVETLLDFIKEDIGIDNAVRILTGLAAGMLMQEDLIKYIDSITDAGESLAISEAITFYQINHFMEDWIENIDEEEDELTERVLEVTFGLIKKWFGYTSYSEAQNLMNGLLIIAEQDEEPDKDILEMFKLLKEGFEGKIKEES